MLSTILIILCSGSKVFPAFVAIIKSPKGDDSKIEPLKAVRKPDART